MNRFQHQLLLRPWYRQEILAEAVLRFFIYGLQTVFVSDAVLRHIFVAITHRLIDVKTMIERADEVDLAIGSPVRLRNQLAEYCIPELNFLCGEEFSFMAVFDPVDYQLTGCIVPE